MEKRKRKETINMTLFRILLPIIALICLLSGAYIVERYSEKHGQLTDDWVLKSVIVAVALFVPIILIVKAIL